MREATLVLDLLEGGKLRSGSTMFSAGEALCRAFGGYTSTISVGCWRNGGDLTIDTSVSYHIAIQPQDWPALRDLALLLAEGQETVYIVSPDGYVEILPVPPIVEQTAVILPEMLGAGIGKRHPVRERSEILGKRVGDAPE